jgi:hypothetical protein
LDTGVPTFSPQKKNNTTQQNYGIEMARLLVGRLTRFILCVFDGHYQNNI